MIEHLIGLLYVLTIFHNLVKVKKISFYSKIRKIYISEQMEYVGVSCCIEEVIWWYDKKRGG
jgi:hypothetical protein